MPNPQQLFQSAIEHHQAGRLAEAGELYRQILAETPRQPDAMHLLGVVAHQMGDDAQAVDLIGQSIALNPNSPEAHSDLGISLRESGRVDESIAACRLAIELRPDFADAHSNLSLALADKGQFEQAITAGRERRSSWLPSMSRPTAILAMRFGIRATCPRRLWHISRRWLSIPITPMATTISAFR